MAQIEISPEYDLAAIAVAAGQNNADARRYADGVLYVEGVTQAALDNAAAAYDHAQTLFNQTRIVLEFAVDEHLDAQARARGYSSIVTAVTYADEPADPAFQAEGIAFRKWRSEVYRACYSMLADVLAGKRAIPTVEALIAELPTLQL